MVPGTPEKVSPKVGHKNIHVAGLSKIESREPKVHEFAWFGERKFELNVRRQALFRKVHEFPSRAEALGGGGAGGAPPPPHDDDDYDDRQRQALPAPL